MTGEISDSLTERESTGIGLPADPSKPLFVYGNLKPGELGHDLFDDNDLTSAARGSVLGYVWVRDGVPILHQGPGESVQGFLLWFESVNAYATVGRFEPAQYYQWSHTACSTLAGDFDANVLVAAADLNPAKGGGDRLLEQDPPWSTSNDPLFRFGLAAVADVLRADGFQAFASTPEMSAAEWARFYRLQAAYLLACSLLERIAFRVVPEKDSHVASAVNKLGRKSEFVEAVQEVGLQNLGRSVWSTKDPTASVNLNHPRQFAAWAYQVRSNLTHRGKSAFKEAELVRTALLDLHDSLRLYLLKKVPGLRGAWAEIDAGGEGDDWRVKMEVAP